METILVVNAGSSSLKFQGFALGMLPDLKCLVKGQIGGIGTRPRLRAHAADKKTLIDQTYTSDQVIDLPAAMHAAGVRVHAISPGPLATRAASGIPEFDALLDKAKAKAPARILVKH